MWSSTSCPQACEKRLSWGPTPRPEPESSGYTAHPWCSRDLNSFTPPLPGSMNTPGSTLTPSGASTHKRRGHRPLFAPAVPPAQTAAGSSPGPCGHWFNLGSFLELEQVFSVSNVPTRTKLVLCHETEQEGSSLGCGRTTESGAFLGTELEVSMTPGSSGATAVSSQSQPLPGAGPLFPRPAATRRLGQRAHDIPPRREKALSSGEWADLCRAARWPSHHRGPHLSSPRASHWTSQPLQQQE